MVVFINQNKFCVQTIGFFSAIEWGVPVFGFCFLSSRNGAPSFLNLFFKSLKIAVCWFNFVTSLDSLSRCAFTLSLSGIRISSRSLCKLTICCSRPPLKNAPLFFCSRAFLSMAVSTIACPMQSNVFLASLSMLYTVSADFIDAECKLLSSL